MAFSLAGSLRAETMTFLMQPFPPMIRDDNGVARGPMPEMMHKLCAAMKVDCILKFNPWRRALQAGEVGEVDGLLGLVRLPERESKFYLSPPLIQGSYAVFARRKQAGLYRASSDLAGHTIGVYGPSGTELVAHRAAEAVQPRAAVIREISNETAGEHFTPREVIRLMVNLLFIEDDDVLTAGSAVVRTLYDPTAGTGGMLSVAGEYLLEHNPAARLTMFGQELNDESYAICKADMLIKGQDVANIAFGNTLSDDGHGHKKFDYMLSNPPFGVEWKKVEKEVRKEAADKGFDGRFGPGLPRVSDGSMLFLLHLISKMRPAVDGGSRIGLVLNGSPLFTGGAGSGESEIRRYVLENDLVEAIIGLPTDMFYNTGISTYIWILSNKKPPARKGWVQLIDASSFWQKMRKSLGSKRKELSDAHIADITRLFGDFAEAEQAIVLDAAGKEVSRQLQLTGKTPPSPPNGGKVKIVPIARVFKNEAFGYTTLTVERPLRDEAGAIVLGSKGKQKGKLQPDSALRDTENVPLADDIAAYFKREVLPHAPDAWIDPEKSKVGYEIPFNRHFYVFEPPRSLHEIDEELKGVTANIMRMLEGLAE